MQNIRVKVLNPSAVDDSIKMMLCAARLTQRGHCIKDIDDFMALYDKPVFDGTVKALVDLPHPTIQKFGLINVVVIGASRRFLAQITRHQNEVKFMSGSLQYSNYKDFDSFVVPYNLLGPDKAELRTQYLEQCKSSMRTYKSMNLKGLDNDSCGYASAQGLRNILIISATPYQWKHMISQRICRRNTDETRYVMLKIWEQLYKLSPILFSAKSTGANCMKQGTCPEGKMWCGKMCSQIYTPTELLRIDYPLCKTELNN